MMSFGDSPFLSSSLVPGIIFVYTVFKYTGSTILIGPIFAILSLMFFFLLIKKFVFEGDEFKAAIAVILYALSGAFIYVANTPFKDVIASTFFFGALYYSFLFSRDGRKMDAAIFSLFAGASIWLSYASILFIIPSIVLILVKQRKSVFVPKNLAALLVPFLIIFLPLILYQVSFTGGFLKFNSPDFVLNYADEDANPRGILSFLLSSDVVKLGKNFVNQVLTVSQGVVTLFLILVLSLLFRKRKVNVYIIILIIVIFLHLFFYLPKTWSGEDFVGSVGTSYARYLLVPWGLMISLSLLALFSCVRSKKMIVLLLFLVLSSGVLIGINSEMSYSYFIRTAEWGDGFKKQIELNTPSNAIVFAGFNDKYVYPVRTIAIYPAIPRDVRLQKTVEIASSLCEEGYPVYFTEENPPSNLGFSFGTYKQQFESKGFVLSKVSDRLYEVCS
ncbi:MAG: hypothetical protein ABH864_00530 [archaeon]